MLVLFLAWVPQRWQEAETILANLERVHQDSIDVKMSRATWLLKTLGRPGDAVPILEDVLVTDPDHLWARFWLVRAWYMLGEFDRAELMPYDAYNWQYVLSPDQAGSLAHLRSAGKEPESIHFGRRALIAYAMVMLRDWQGATDMLALESGDPDLFTQTYSQQLLLTESPALTLAVAYKALGDQENSARFAALEQKAVNIRTENGRYHNFNYSRAMARLHALRGNDYEALLELERLVSRGPVDPRELIHPAYDSLRDNPRFTRLISLQRTRVDEERFKLGLPPLATDSVLYLSASR
jgi:hypothetical protein